LRDVSVAYGRRSVLHHIDLCLPEGSFLGLIGPNGSGKTTLLRAILGLVRPVAGEIEYRAGRAPRFGYIQQSQSLDDLFPLTVEEIVLMGRIPLRGPFRPLRRADRTAAAAAMETTGVRALADQLYRDLSGGQKQRCLLARALATEPELLALDEPTSDMDIGGEERTLQLVARLREERGLTVIMVSHRVDVVVNVVDRLALLRDGRLEAGPASEMLTARRLEEFLGVPVILGRVGHRRVIVPDATESAGGALEAGGSAADTDRAAPESGSTRSCSKL
jgi:ABC-type Mn2+/Zn2+ transport system ATPase subunit